MAHRVKELLDGGCGVAHRIDELEFAGCAACAWRAYHELVGVLAAIDRFRDELPERVRIILDLAKAEHQALFYAVRKPGPTESEPGSGRV